MDVVRKTKCAHKVNQTFSSILFTMAGLQGKITGQTKKLENVTHTQGKTKKKKKKKKKSSLEIALEKDQRYDLKEKISKELL